MNPAYGLELTQSVIQGCQINALIKPFEEEPNAFHAGMRGFEGRDGL